MTEGNIYSYRRERDSVIVLRRTRRSRNSAQYGEQVTLGQLIGQMSTQQGLETRARDDFLREITFICTPGLEGKFVVDSLRLRKRRSDTTRTTCLEHTNSKVA